MGVHPAAGFDEAVEGSLEAGEDLGKSFGGIGHMLVNLHLAGLAVKQGDGCILLMSIQTDVVHFAVSLR